jgi:L-asparaginase II
MSVEVTRGGLVESRHQVHVAVVNAAGELVASAGDPHRPTILRSAAKPLQAVPLLETGAFDAFGFDDAILAVCCASHVGASEHVEAVSRGFALAGLDPALLRNTQGSVQDRLQHNCSGNHLGFLAASVHAGWPVESYREPGHPSQVAARTAVARAAGLSPHEVPICVDGCGVVAFELPLAQIAGIYARLPAEQPRQVAAMRAHPQLVRGDGRLDTELMRAVPGAVVKGGAEGLGCLGLPEQGLGAALRAEDGSDRAVGPAVLDVVAQLLEWPSQPVNLRDLAAPSVRNAPGDEVGMVKSDVVLTTSDSQEL